MKKSTLFWAAVTTINTIVAAIVFWQLPASTQIDTFTWPWVKLMYSLFSILGVVGYGMFHLAEFLYHKIRKFNNWLDKKH